MWDISLSTFHGFFNLTTRLFVWGAILLGGVLGVTPGLNATMGMNLGTRWLGKGKPPRHWVMLLYAPAWESLLVLHE
jgi:hypothetical protein